MFWDDEETALLKKVKIEEWRKRDEDAKIKDKIAREAIKRDQETLKRNKELEKKNVSSDSNGRIIMIKQYNIEKLIPDFIISKVDLKDKEEKKLLENTDYKEKKLKPIVIQHTEEKNDKLDKPGYKRKTIMQSGMLNNPDKSIVQEIIQPLGSNYEYIKDNAE